MATFICGVVDIKMASEGLGSRSAKWYNCVMREIKHTKFLQLVSCISQLRLDKNDHLVILGHTYSDRNFDEGAILKVGKLEKYKRARYGWKWSVFYYLRPMYFLLDIRRIELVREFVDAIDDHCLVEFIFLGRKNSSNYIKELRESNCYVPPSSRKYNSDDYSIVVDTDVPRLESGVGYFEWNDDSDRGQRIRRQLLI